MESPHLLSVAPSWFSRGLIFWRRAGGEGVGAGVFSFFQEKIQTDIWNHRTYSLWYHPNDMVLLWAGGGGGAGGSFGIFV